MTFSIVAHDPETGALGIAVASKAPAVGAVVPYARAGVGAMAIQSCGDFGYGPRGLELLLRGVDPQAAIATLTGDDPDAALRQVGVVDAGSRAATYTGASCGPWAGGAAGPHYACQGNVLTGAEVVQAMTRAFLATPGDLDVRLLAALVAGQSAALLVLREGSELGFDGRYVDLRVDDHADAVAELARILNVWRPAVRLPRHTIR